MTAQWESNEQQQLGSAALLHYHTQTDGDDVPGDLLSPTAYDWGLYGVRPRQSFRSFGLRPPLLNFLQWDERCDSGYTLLTPRGTLVTQPAPIILDARGELVWMDDRFGTTMNMKVQNYRGEQYLTFWAGTMDISFGRGTYYMLDSSYQVYKQFSAANSIEGDFHEFSITENGTALLTMYPITPADLTSLGVKGQGWIYDGVFQEIDIETGELLFEWRASDHYAVNETFYPIDTVKQAPNNVFDFFHINSIDKDEAGNYYISSRFMHTITCISPTGEIRWIYGGKRNGFTDLSDGAATDFKFQHHARLHDNGTMTIFDNGKYEKWYQDWWKTQKPSRGLLMQLDTEQMTAELLQEYINPDMRGVASQGSMQILPDSGNVLVGWGYYGSYTEFTPDGDVLCHIHYMPEVVINIGWVGSYRSFRTNTWVGRPKDHPAIYLKPSEKRVYVSWNGATEIDHWVLQTTEGEASDELVFTDAVTATKRGFETSIEVPRASFQYLRVAAVDKTGNVLATTLVVDKDKGNAPPDKFWTWIVVCVMLICVAYASWRARRWLTTTAQAASQKLNARARPYRETFRMKEERGASDELEPLYDD
ncbi:hypothetical protein PMZ80_003300 [Knufia obscura]|uniref:Arylsulfotransferase n=1 Tax=Knufia obscura TaxID=1635080 RepID=A0ABR0RVF2_9EURO|nr:hypothetical protein PMZ80_003300 [Knufia obscura]